MKKAELVGGVVELLVVLGGLLGFSSVMWIVIASFENWFITVNTETGLAGLSVASMFFLAIALPVSVAAAVVFFRACQRAVAASELQELRSRIVENGRELEKFKGYLWKNVTSAKKIVEGLFPEHPATQMSLNDNCHYTFEMAEHGDTTVTESFDIIVEKEPVHWIRKYATADPESDPIEWHDDIGLRVTVTQAGNSIPLKSEILPMDIQDRYLKYSIVFLPRLQPGNIYHIEVVYTWPGLSKKIVNGNVIAWSIQQKRLKPDGKITITAIAAKSLGNLTPDVIVSKGVTLEETTKIENGKSIYQFHGVATSPLGIDAQIQFYRN